MLVLNILPLFILLQECLCTSELVTILSDSTSQIKECSSPGAGTFLRDQIKRTSLYQNSALHRSSVLPKGFCEHGRCWGGHADIPSGESHDEAPEFGHRIWIRGLLSISTFCYGCFSTQVDYFRAPMVQWPFWPFWTTSSTQIWTTMIPIYSSILKTAGLVKNINANKWLWSLLCLRPFSGCHVLIQSGEVENQGEVEGMTGDALYAPPSSSSRFIDGRKSF